MSKSLHFRTADECRRLAYEALQAATGLAPRERGLLVILAVEYELLAKALDEKLPPPTGFDSRLTVPGACACGPRI